MAADYLALTDLGLLAWGQNAYARLDGSAGDFGLSDPQIATFQTKLAAYNTALTAATETTTRTKPAIQLKNAARKAFVAYARECVKLIQATPGITDAQRAELKITIAKKPAPIPAPGVSPMVEVTSVSVRTVILSVYDPTSATKRNRPKNCVGYKVYYFVGTAYPSDPMQWQYAGDYTKNRCEIPFPSDTPAGQQVWATAAWYTQKGDVGPAAAPVTTNLPGGGATTQLAGMKMAA